MPVSAPGLIRGNTPDPLPRNNPAAEPPLLARSRPGPHGGHRGQRVGSIGHRGSSPDPTPPAACAESICARACVRALVRPERRRVGRRRAVAGGAAPAPAEGPFPGVGFSGGSQPPMRGRLGTVGVSGGGRRPAARGREAWATRRVGPPSGARLGREAAAVRGGATGQRATGGLRGGGRLLTRDLAGGSSPSFTPHLDFPSLCCD